MGKRKSKSIDPKDFVDSDAEVSREVDVAGPLTLEEAKAVGDVPEDFKVESQDEGGILKKATSMFTGSESKTSKDPEREAAPERKSVSFADEPQISAGETPITPGKEEKATRKKSLLSFLNIKKKKDQSTASEAIAEEPSERKPSETSTAMVESTTNDEPKTEAIDGTSTEAKEPYDAATKTDVDSAQHKKRNVLSNLFHRKGKAKNTTDNDESSNGVNKKDNGKPVISEGTDTDEQVQKDLASDVVMKDTGQRAEDVSAASEIVDQKDMAGNQKLEELSPKEVEENNLGTHEMDNEQQLPNIPEELQDEKSTKSNGNEATVPSEERPKEASREHKPGLFGKLFHRGNEKKTKDDVAIATGATAAGVGVGAATAAAVSDTEQQQPEKSSTDAEQPTEQPEKRCFWRPNCPRPAPGATAIKEGTAYKMGYLFQIFRARHIRIMSDGLFQYCRTSNWSNPKGVKLSGRITLNASDNHTKIPFILKINIPGSKSITLGFQGRESRDEWLHAFENIKTGLQAAMPDDDDHTQVMKTNSMEQESVGTSENNSTPLVEAKA